MNWIVNFYQWFISADTKAESVFRAGYIWGIIATLFFLVLVRICYYYFWSRNKKVSDVRIPANGGDLFISASALIDMVKIVAVDFDYIDVSKIYLWETKAGITMRVKVKYDTMGKQFPELCQEFKDAIQENLQGRLGVENIRKIEVYSSSTTRKKNSKF